MGRQVTSGTAKSKAAKEDMRKEDARRHVHSSESALISLHPTQLPQRAACARGLTSVDLSRRAGGLPVTILTSQTTHLTCLSRRHESRDSNVLPPSHTHALTSDHCKLCPSAWRAHSPGIRCMVGERVTLARAPGELCQLVDCSRSFSRTGMSCPAIHMRGWSRATGQSHRFGPWPGSRT